MKQLYRVVATRIGTEHEFQMAVNCNLATAERIKAAHEKGRQAEKFTYSIEPQD